MPNLSRMNSRSLSVDFLRGCSILLVIITHGFFNMSLLGLDRILPAQNFTILRSNGYLGVSIFFVISGFLITSSLLNRNNQSPNDEDTVALKFELSSFYAKRIGRLFPPLILLFVISVVLSYIGGIYLLDFELQPKLLFFTAAFHAFTFTYNGYYLGLGGSTPGLRHFIPLWSLAIEEVFYLVWPILLKGLKSTRLILVFLGVLIIFAPAYRIEHGYISQYHYLGCVDMLALGSLVAFLRKSAKISKIANRAIFLLPVTLLVIFFVLCVVDIDEHFVIAPSLVGGLTGFYLLLSNNFDQRTARVIYFKYLVSPLSLLGMLSYEVYLFHLMFMNIFYRLDFNNGTNYLSGPVPLVSLMLFSYFLHRFLFEPTRIKLTKYLK